MPLHELAGKPAPPKLLTDIPELVTAYFSRNPDLDDPSQRVSFGTSGHRGSSFLGSFNEAHVLACAQAVCDFRKASGIHGPLFLGKDTHALSTPSFLSTLEVLAANGVEVMIQQGGGYTPTPVISHAILTYNRQHRDNPADGIIITPSHNPPDDGGFKYNPPSGGPADTAVTGQIQERANQLLENANRDVRRMLYEKARSVANVHGYDYIQPYVGDLENILEMDRIRNSSLRIGVDPLGGAAVAYWEAIGERYGLDLDIVNPAVDPTFRFMTLDKDGKIRMDCSSPFAMAGLVAMKDRYDIAFGNDPDADRHGIVTTRDGLLNPNHYLSAVVWYLFQNRPGWPESASVGKTLVSSAMIDRVAAALGRDLNEVPVGFKWFVDGLLRGDCAFGGEESAGASFLRKDGSVWTTDKDGILLNLLAAEMIACTSEDPSQIYAQLAQRFGAPVYERIDAPADGRQKALLANLTPEHVTVSTLGGDPVLARITRAPGNDAPIGGLKVVTQNGWFAARPSGTESIYKIYTESFLGRDHLAMIQDEAKAMVDRVFSSAGL
ncbi:MAG: phosphoglucomutase (alpha-D-glucose-1,6-bisphosphate-dependent) [Desulfobacterales bacterium]|jgi:phosphoglucomutase